MAQFYQNPVGGGQSWRQFSQIKWKWKRKLKNEPHSNKKGKDVLKKMTRFSGCLNYTGLSYFGQHFLEKISFSRGRSGRSSCPFCPRANYNPHSNSLPLSGWRSVGMWFWKLWKENSKLFIKEWLLIIIITYSNYLLDNFTLIFFPYVRLCIQWRRKTNENISVGEFR